MNYIPSNIIKLYPNGAKYKWDDRGDNTGKYITIYENEKGDLDEFVKYKDLGKKQYNYNKDYYKNYKDPNLFNTNCNIIIKFKLIMAIIVIIFIIQLQKKLKINIYMIDG